MIILMYTCIIEGKLTIDFSSHHICSLTYLIYEMQKLMISKKLKLKIN